MPTVGELLGGREAVGGPVDSNLDLAKATRKGLPSAVAIQLAREILEIKTEPENAAIEPGSWLVHLHGEMHARNLLIVGFEGASGFGALIGSLEGPHSQGRRLTPVESDLVVRTASILAKAIDVLGEKSKAVHWIKTPNAALGGLVPLSLLDTSAGEHEVEALLDRIEYGVYS